MKREIGHNMYLFTEGAANPSKVVISSHGGILATTDMFQTPVELGFLGNTGESVALALDNAIANFDFSNRQQFEVEPAGTRVRDYKLSKFQGRHTAHRNKISHLWGKLTCQNHYEETYSTIEADLANYSDVGVLTIRNRTGRHKGDVRLSDAVVALDALGINKILCLFCRVHTVYEQVDTLPGGMFAELEGRFGPP